jgi:uroporphyrinogen-III decarboxylase
MRGSMLDMYRQPDKLIEACDFILKKMIQNIKPASPGSNIRCGIPLHRGAEGFMSIKQFETFYWPTLKGLILALIDNGYIPSIAFEGDYSSRLEYLLELPKGKIFAHMDTTDIFKAKAVLGGHMCISGNIPISLLQAGTQDDFREQCRKIIDVCGKDGGFIMSTSTTLDDARPDNIKAMIDFTLEYGVYR